MHSLLYGSATDLAASIRAKQISSEEAVRAYLHRIDEINPAINAVAELRAEQALDDARKADESLARGEYRGPLHGLPVTIKESIAVEGLVWSGGTLGRASVRASEDAVGVRRLREAGAIVLATTNVPEMSFAYETVNLIHGQTNNPYDLSRTPGGSTGGEAALVAAGGSPVGLGGDFMGSIRLPSHFCGIAGLKPTPGRIPGAGYFPSGGALPYLLAQSGPMARYVDDLSLLLPVLAGVDECDPFTVPVPLHDPTRVSLRGLRIAFFTNNGISKPSPEIREAVVGAARALEAGGVYVTEAVPPGVEQSMDLFTQLLGADGGEGTEKVTPLFAEMLGEGPSKSASEFLSSWHHWNEWRLAMARFFESYDAVLSPVCAQAAMPHGTTARNFADFSYVQTWSFTASPAAVVRVAESGDGLPVGVQIVPKHWREDVALAIARHLERSFGGWKQAAALDAVAA